jgi:predicted acyl esterase
MPRTTRRDVLSRALPCLLAVLAAWLLCSDAAAQRFFERGQMYDRVEPRTNGWLRKMLAQFPEADSDGILTEEEARYYHFKSIPQITAHFRETEFVPEGVTKWMAMVPMRDGFELPTAVYFPHGPGPWGTVLSRGGGAGTEGALDIGSDFLAQGLVFVQQATRGPGVPAVERDTTYDGYDCIEWIAAQPWSNGKVGQMGYSAGGMQNKRDCLTNPPHLTVSINCIASSSRTGTWWRGRGGEPGEEPPTIATRGAQLDFATIDLAGWFDMFTQGQIDDWLAMRHTGKAMLVMGCGGHGPLDAAGRLPPFYGDCDIFWPRIPGWKWLTGEFDESDAESIAYYFLMGDTTNPDAPGNVWKVTREWPVPHVAASYYMTRDGGLRLEHPQDAAASLTYEFDPADPTPSIGRRGGGEGTGPLDQRPLRTRTDILRFAGDPLTEPLEITGRVAVELHVSSDSPEAVFRARLIDVYPDGYEWPVLGFSTMTRYADGEPAGPASADAEVRKVTIDLFSTALVVDRGHRIAVHVSSEPPPARGRGGRGPTGEAEPPGPVTRNTVHVSAEHPSRLILPVVQPGVSQDYVP